MGNEAISDVVLRRLKEHGDFGAMADTITKVNSLTSSEDSNAAQLASVILDDYSLTNKVLRVVNSAIFAQTTEVTTISRAIVVLGWKSIQSLVLTLKLFASTPVGADPDLVKKGLGGAFLTGMLARNFSSGVRNTNPEESFVCALFHTFGQILVAYYLPAEAAEIRRRVDEHNKHEEVSARRVLGMTYAEIGQRVAKELNFPSLVTDSMNPSPRARTRQRPTREEATAGIAALCASMSKILLDDTADTKKRIEGLVQRFESTFGTPTVDLDELVEKSVAQFSEYASVMQLPIAPLATARRAIDNFRERPPSEVETPVLAEPEVAEPTVVSEAETDRIFAEGIQEATTSLVGEATLSQVVLVVLETMFRGLAFAGAGRAVFLIRDAVTGALAYRSGLGHGLADAGAWFRIPMDDAGIFRIALDAKKDLYVAQLSLVDAGRALPGVLRARVDPNAFVLVLPIVVSGRPIGAFYVDGAGDTQLQDKHMRYLAVLRDQVVLAVRQSSSRAA